MRDLDDFRATTYAALKRSADSGARYVELFFSPAAHEPVVDYPSMVDGIVDGMRAAREDFGLRARLIPAHNRELGLERGMAFLETVLRHHPLEVIGIGLDYTERPHPPAQFAPLFAAARAAGLEVTAHAGEDGPASYVRDAIDLLGCRRIDDGYHVVDDPALMERCKQLDVLFTVRPTTTLHTTVWRDMNSPKHAIRRMIEAGLRVTFNTDDPGLFATTLNRDMPWLPRHLACRKQRSPTSPPMAFSIAGIRRPADDRAHQSRSLLLDPIVLALRAAGLTRR